MKPLDHKTMVRAHTPPHTPDGVALACALQVACYLAHQRQVSRIRMWSGASANARDVFATAISEDLLEPLLREGAVTSDGFQFELQAGESLQAPGDAVVLAICVDHAEFEKFLQANSVGAAIYMPRSEEDLQAYVSATPDSNAIGWREEKSEPHDTSNRTDELNRRLAWHREHYRVIEAGSLGGENGHAYAKHDGTGRCRYCGRSSPEVTFRSKSHAFPEQIGNKTLIDPAECDARVSIAVRAALSGDGAATQRFVSDTEASMEDDSTLYVGLDVHKDSITVAYSIGMSDVELLGKIGTTQIEIDRLCKRLQSKARRVRVVYEAGPCGYGLYRRLIAKGFDCMVCAPSLIPQKPGDRVKTDRRDAVKLVRSLRAGDLSAVHVPTVEDEAFRDLARAWSSARDDLKQARQRLKSFLLSHGVQYSGRANWGPAHRRWLSTLSFSSAWQQLAFNEHRRTIEDRLAQCERLEVALREAVTSWRFYPVVLALQAMRGIQFVSAVGLVSEVGDLSRFEHPRQLMAWLGVTPSEHSSGDKRRQGSITKTGNSYARKLLVESAWSYRHPARVSIDIQRRHEGIPKQIIDRAWDAQLRLCRRYRKLVARGKSPQVAIIALARELAGFIWDIGRMGMTLALPQDGQPA